MGKFCNYILKGLMVAALLGLAGLGTAKADPAACTTATLAFYVSNYAGGCELGTSGIVVSDFGAGATGFTGSGTTSPTGTANLLITPILSGVDGVGLEFTAPLGWTAQGGGQLDAEVPFEVSCLSGAACITDLYMEMTGSATGNAPGNQDVLLETYCLGAAPAPPSCVNPPAPTLTISGTSTPVTVKNTINFTGVSEISIGKDMGAFENGAGFPEGTATINDVINEFSTTPTSTPEPSSLLMLGSGLLGLMGLGLRRRGIV